MLGCCSTGLNLSSTSNMVLVNATPHKNNSFLVMPTTTAIIKPNPNLSYSCSINHTTITKSSWKSTTSVKTSVAAVDSSEPTLKEEEQGGRKKYHFVVANAKFMLDDEEHFQELLSERLRNYAERNIEQDFWLVIEPKFLDNFPNITKRLSRPAVALVSTNASWITYMKLRLDRVLEDSYEADSVEEALASNPTNIEFAKPDKWTAPYPKYQSGWWETFLLSKTSPKV